MLSKKIILSLLISTGTYVIGAAQCPVSGSVYDALLHESLPGIEVKIKEMPDLRAVTNREGSFLIDSPCTAKITLYFEGIGYFTKTLPLLHKQEPIEVLMNENIFEWMERIILIASNNNSLLK
jgi:hypothetical protein